MLVIIVYLSLFFRVTLSGFVATLSRVDQEGVKESGTAVIILPQWILTSFKCVTNYPLKEYTVTVTLDKGESFTNSLSDTMYCNERHADKPSVCLLKTVKAFPGNSSTAPIATRTDMLWHSVCFIYASDESYKIIKHSAKLLKRNCPEALGQIRGVIVCAKTNTQLCELPCGTVLMCGDRVLGIRHDTVKCANRFVFASLQSADRHVLETLQQQKAGIIRSSVSAQKFGIPASGGSISCVISVKLLWICLIIFYLSKLRSAN